MPISLSSVGETSPTRRFDYDWKTLATYALGVGAKKDELAYLYEGVEGGLQVLPTFAVVPAFAAVVDCLAKTGGDMAMVVHGAQTIRAHRALPDKGTLETTGKLEVIYDLKKFAQAIVETRTTLGGELVYETTWSIIYRGSGGFGGPRPPESDIPSIPKGKEPDFMIEEATSPEQALLYRISGDTNPLHADPAFAERVGFPQGPILHGLCTFGFAGRAVIRAACGGDAKKLSKLVGQFRKPVWPGDTLITRGYTLEDGRIALTTHAKDRPDVVLGGYAAVST